MKIIAHRGASSECQENTIAAVKRALEIGVDAVEVDVMLSKEKRLVVRHDDLIRKNGEWRYVHELTFNEIRSIDLGGMERTPDLESVFKAVDGQCALVLDIKHYGTAPLLADFLRRHRDGSEVHVTSFLHSEVSEIGRRCPAVDRSINMAAVPIDLKKILKDTGTRKVGLFRGYLNEDLAGRVHGLGASIRVYAVNLAQEAERFAAWGVEAVYTDDPRSLRRLRLAGMAKVVSADRSYPEPSLSQKRAASLQAVNMEIADELQTMRRVDDPRAVSRPS